MRLSVPSCPSQADDSQEEPQDPHVKDDDHPGGQVEGVQL